MARATFEALAKVDLRDIFRQIARRDGRPLNARRVTAAIRNHCNEHATHVATGHVLGVDRSDIGVGLRTFAHQRWIILFRITGKRIQVLAVVDGTRDYGSVFLERSATE